jgi:hypothetical protein
MVLNLLAPVLRVAILLLALVCGVTAYAGTVVISSTGAPVVITLDGAVVGPTELTLTDVAPGKHRIGFRSSTFAADAFSESIYVSKQGGLKVLVDLDARRAEVSLVEEQPKESVKVKAASEAPAASKKNAAAKEVATITELVPPPAPAPPPMVKPPPAPEPPAVQVPSGDLYIVTSIEGASLELKSGDKVRKVDGVSPTLVKALPAGKYTIIGQTACAYGELSIEVLANRITRAEMALERGDGTLSVMVKPAGATIFLDGAEAVAFDFLDGSKKGSGNQVFENVTCGEHEITVRASGYLEHRQTVSASPSKVTMIEVNLEKETFGALVVGVTPLTARVQVDGVDVATGPVTIEPIATGPHAVTVTLDGYRPVTREAVIQSDMVSRVDITLEIHKHSGVRGRVIVNGSVTALGVVAAALGAVHYKRAAKNFRDFLDETVDTEAQDMYNEVVLPDKKRYTAEFSAAGVFLALGAVLWVSTDYSSAAPPAVLRISGRW